MSHPICPACETCAHCLKNGCIPVQTPEPKALMMAPYFRESLPEIDPSLIPEAE